MIISPDNVIKMNLIIDLKNSDLQVQPSGLDLRLKSVYRIEGPGILDFDNKNRKIPKHVKIDFVNDELLLPLGSYIVEFEEKIILPKDVTTFLYPRSSLIRSGVTFQSGLFDAGYSGTLGGIINVLNLYGVIFKKDARIVQCVCFKMERPSSKGYSGIYK